MRSVKQAEQFGEQLDAQGKALSVAREERRRSSRSGTRPRRDDDLEARRRASAEAATARRSVRSC